MVRWVIIIVTVIAVAVVGLTIFIISWGKESPSISQEEASLPLSPVPTPVTIPVSINAVPWARVFIKLPKGDDFIEPRAENFTISPESNRQNSNITPIRGGLKVPIGTTIKLVYQDAEKIFPYEVWKEGQTISHDFLNQ